MVLLDTNAVIWLAQRPTLLSQRARDAIREARSENGIAASDQSLWEIAMIVTRKQVRVEPSLEDFLQAVERNLHIFPVDTAIAARSVRFSSAFPRDPADRIIAATALVHSIPLITADKLIIGSGEVPCIW